MVGPWSLITPDSIGEQSYHQSTLSKKTAWRHVVEDRDQAFEVASKMERKLSRPWTLDYQKRMDTTVLRQVYDVSALWRD